MNSLRKRIKPDEKRDNLFYVGTKCKKSVIYKYLSLESVLICLEKGEIRFQQPSEWPDKYESLFYNANYDRLGVGEELHPRLFACCFTTKKMSEAAWKVYSYNKNGLAHRCVKLGINLDKLRTAFDNYAKQYGFKVYECMIDYSLEDEEIITLHKRSNPHYPELFEDFSDVGSYLSLLSIKRKAFSYESELRFFLVPDDCKKKMDVKEDVTLSYSYLIESIAIDGGCTEMEKSILEVYSKKHGIDVEVKTEKLYYCPSSGVTIEGDVQKYSDKVLEFVKNNPGCTRNEIKSRINISNSLLYRRLLEYKNEGLMECRREGNNYKWYSITNKH